MFTLGPHPAGSPVTAVSLLCRDSGQVLKGRLRTENITIAVAEATIDSDKSACTHTHTYTCCTCRRRLLWAKR